MLSGASKNMMASPMLPANPSGDDDRLRWREHCRCRVEAHSMFLLSLGRMHGGDDLCGWMEFYILGDVCDEPSYVLGLGSCWYQSEQGCGVSCTAGLAVGSLVSVGVKATVDAWSCHTHYWCYCSGCRQIVLHVFGHFQAFWCFSLCVGPMQEQHTQQEGAPGRSKPRSLVLESWFVNSIGRSLYMVLLAFEQTLSTCSFHLRSEEIVTLRYLADVQVSSSLPCSVYWCSNMCLRLVTLRTWHFSH